MLKTKELPSLREALARCIILWAVQQKRRHGDRFATATEFKAIKSDPLGYAGLLRGTDAHNFVMDVIDGDISCQ